jgi:DnaJ-domain-containing protein 1
MLASNATLERRLKELEKKYDAQFKAVFDAIRQLMAPPEKPSKKIGLRLREKHPSYAHLNSPNPLASRCSRDYALRLVP